MKNEQLKKYADVLVHIGLNVQQDEILFVDCDIDVAPLARLVTESAYNRGAKLVKVNYSDGEITKLNYHHQTKDTLSEVPDYIKEELRYITDEKVAYLKIMSENPDLLKAVDQEKILTRQRAMIPVQETMQKNFSSFVQTWVIAAYPSVEWAEMVFPDLTEEAAVSALLDAILKAVRIDDEDPVQGWKQHIANLTKRADWLTDKGFDALHYKAPGTDLTVGLLKGGQWVKAQKTNKKGTDIIVNMPTEEVYSSPDFRRVNGYVSNSLPLSLNGKIVDGFKLTFKDGVVTDYEAEQGFDALQALLDIDQGAKQLGEIAIVPVNSPIYETGLLFYNTLFDENASCHLALGSSFAEVLAEAEDKTDEERTAMGLNDSHTHVDFMIGSEQLDIDGIYADGKREPVFRSGRWAD